MNKYILGVVASLAYNMEEQREDYGYKLEISQDVLDWLLAHDIKIDEEGRKIFVCNAIEYVYLGPAPVVIEVPLKLEQKDYTA